MRPFEIDNLSDVTPFSEDSSENGNLTHSEFDITQAGNYDPTEVVVAKTTPSSNGSHPESDLNLQEIDCGSAAVDRPRHEQLPGYVRKQLEDTIAT